MSLKVIVDSFLEANFNEIQSARSKVGFSWRPVVVEVNKSLVDKLDPDKESDRDYVRNRFIALRKAKEAVNFVQVGEVKPIEFVTTSFPPPKNKEPYEYIDTYNILNLKPVTEADEFKLWQAEKKKLQRQVGLHVVGGCIHFPAVNQPFYQAFLRFLDDHKSELKGIHLIGDILDCKSLSQHDKGQVSDTTLEKEYTESNKYLDMLDSVLPVEIEKNFIWGNHEDRYTRILKQVDISKFGKALLSPTAGGRFLERGYTVQEDYINARIQLGKHLELTHGQYITANACKKHLDVYKRSIMFAHTHKMGTYFDADKAAFNIGWMGEASHSAFSYCSRVVKESWQNGFAVVNIDSDGFYHVQLIQYYNNRFFYGGREYRG